MSPTVKPPSRTLGVVTTIEDRILRIVYCRLSPELRDAWCRTPGAQYRPALIVRLAAGLVAIDEHGRCR